MNPAALRSLSGAMFRGFVRDRAALVFSVLIPLLFLVLFGSIYKNQSAPRLHVAEVGQVTLLNQALAGSHGQLGKVLDLSPAASLPAAVSGVRKGDYDAAVQQRGHTLIVHYSVADQVTAGVVSTVFGEIVQGANQAATGAPAYRLASQQVEDRSLKPIQYLAPGLLGWAIAAGGTFGAAITLVTWRQNKLLRRLRLAPVGTSSVVSARIGISLAIAMVQLVLFLAVATLPYFGLKLTASWWMSIPVVAAGTLAFMSIGLLVGSFAKTQQAAASIANLIILPMAFLGGAFIPLDFAPAWLRDVSYVMPLRYLVTGMQDVMARGEGPAAALPAIGILLGLTAVLTAVSTRVFRWDDV
ncbi:MAG TPA: ABC transporter permease [Streptosporangiaceae bacterium]|jgi:ABC-2 type transport system permease protein